MSVSKKILIIYHGDCPDGFSGAWVAWKKFGNKAEYFAAERNTPLPRIKGKEVYCIDFTPEPASAVRRMEKEAAHLVLIDHHITAEPRMRFAQEYWFSLKHSGAVLAWQYFFPKKATPQLLRHVEDIDLWKFKLPHSRALGAYIGLFDFDFKTWDGLARKFKSAAGRRRAAEQGALLLKYEDGMVREIVRHAREVRLEGRRVLAANSPVFDSQIGHALAAKKPPFGIVWREEDGHIRVSLRASGAFDVAKIAEKYGGGGHKAAAGFLLKRGARLPWK
ncbi:MAG: hypothetical protein HYW65_03925 [Candidatus Liptonbacteria bacterium]|nr:hypothetical protein [Candidatus Liptonbacteria bacterium]